MAERTLRRHFAGVTQLVEYLPSKQAVASSSLVPRSDHAPDLHRSINAVLFARQLNLRRDVVGPPALVDPRAGLRFGSS